MNLTSFSPRKIAIILASLFAFVFTILLSGSIFETNNAGFFQIKQAALSGELTVVNQPGTYFQNFGTVTTYSLSDEYFFSKHDNDGGSDKEADPIKVRFNDGGTATISGVIKFRLSQDPAKQLLLHNDFKTYVAVKDSLIRQVVTEAVQQTANLMKAEESYSTRRSEFAALAEGQVVDGIYETVANVQKLKDTEGNEFIVTSVNLKMVNGKPAVRKHSSLPRYGVEILQFVIKDIDFDETIENLINKKKEAEQQKVVAMANAERAKQDAITAREQGEAKVAIAKAEEDVKKIQATVAAEKEFEVAKWARQEAEETAKAQLVRGQAEANVARLKVSAGLTPQEKAEFQKSTAIGVAAELAKLKFPSMMILGGDSKGGSNLNPFDAVGLESFMRINGNLVKTVTTSKD
jgi:regulator of protease activity HflC (stomatin/prohibitin superfamily)